jgi:hypothetical protein
VTTRLVRQQAAGSGQGLVVAHVYLPDIGKVGNSNEIPGCRLDLVIQLLLGRCFSAE